MGIKKFETIGLYFLQFTIIIPTYFLTAVIMCLFRYCSTGSRTNGVRPNTNETAQHLQRVLKIQEQVLKWNRVGRKSRMVTGRPEWQTLSLRNYEKTDMSKIMLGKLENIYEVDTNNKIVRMEPGINMGTLSSQLVPIGWTIPVIPELVSLTVGGCICGAGLETSSHKYGLFGDTCISFEVVLADGKLITCSKEENSDIFYSIGMSHGTIGFLVGVTFPLIPAGKYVKLEYFHAKSVTETEKLLQAPENEFVEGIMFDSSKAVVMYGNFVNHPPSDAQINTLGRWYKPWFNKHVEGFLNKPGRHVEYIPTRDYYHRHQRSIFWLMDQIIPFGNHPLFRFFLGWMLPIDVSSVKRVLPKSVMDVYIGNRKQLIQDFILPFSKLKETLELSQDLVEIYPIWLCPVRLTSNPNMAGINNENATEMYIDVGIYGNCKKGQERSMKDTIRELEKFTINNEGFQGLYADNYLTREDFEKMFDLKLYNAMRTKLNCEAAFPHVYDKVSYLARKLE